MIKAQPLLPPANEVCKGYVFTGVRGCSRGGGGGMHGFFRGVVCMVFSAEGMHCFFRGGVCGFFWGACVVFSGGVCMVFSGGGACVGYDEIRSMNGRYASYWNAFLFHK